MATKAKRPAVNVSVTEAGAPIDLDSFVERYVALVMQFDGWRTSSPTLASVA